MNDDGAPSAGDRLASAVARLESRADTEGSRALRDDVASVARAVRDYRDAADPASAATICFTDGDLRTRLGTVVRVALRDDALDVAVLGSDHAGRLVALGVPTEPLFVQHYTFDGDDARAATSPIFAAEDVARFREPAGGG